MSMEIYTIYKATNSINGKHYIGYTGEWPQRMRDHNRNSFNEKTESYNNYFHKAIRKYGKDAFKWEILYQSLDKEYCHKVMETHFIKEYNSCGKGGYNLLPGGRGGKPLGSIPWNKGKKTGKCWWKERGLSKSYIPTKESISKMVEKIAKNYVLFDPFGKEYRIKNLTKFCKENNLLPNKMNAVVNGHIKHHLKWTGHKLQKGES